MRLALPFLGVMAAGPALAQDPPACAASAEAPRRADPAIAAVKLANGPPGSRSRVAMTFAGQALQMSGLCEEASVRTFTSRPRPESRLPGFPFPIAAR